MKSATILDSQQTSITRLARKGADIDLTPLSSAPEYPFIPWTAGVRPIRDSRNRPRSELKALLLPRLAVIANQSGLSLFAYLDKLTCEAVCSFRSSAADF